MIGELVDATSAGVGWSGTRSRLAWVIAAFVGCLCVAIPATAVAASGHSITIGESHACAALASGHVECWGLNESGQLGDGTLEDSYTAVEVEGLTGATQVSAGREHTCAVLSGGHVDCWGSGGDGRAG